MLSCDLFSLRTFALYHCVLRTLRELVKEFHNKISQQERRCMGKNKKISIIGTFKSYRDGFRLLL